MKGDFQYLFGFLIVFAVQGLYTDASNEKFPNRFHYVSVENFERPQSVIEIFHILMKQACELAIQVIELEQSDAQRNFDQVYEQLFKIQQNSNDVLDEILKDYEKLFASEKDQANPCNQVQKQSCVHTHIKELKNALSFGRDDISKCIQIAVAEANNVHESLVPYIESINELIKNISGIIDQCTESSNLIAKEICFIQHVQEVSNSISALIRDNNESIRLASVQVYAVVGQNTQGCTQSSINDVKGNVEQIVEIVKDCISNNSLN